jgi:hypothetical protein
LLRGIQRFAEWVSTEDAKVKEALSFGMYPPPGMPSSPATWEDIERLALHYPAAHHAVTMVERGDLSREQALIYLVYALAGSFQALFAAEVERRRREPFPWART